MRSRPMDLLQDTRKSDEESVSWNTQSQLRHWLPDTMATCCARASVDFPISDEERAQVVNAVFQRQAEFVAARWCAHRALEEICSPTNHIPVGAQGEPQWPPGISGSITHESGICLAVVARTPQFKGIGVDLFDTRRAVEMCEISTLILSKAEGDIYRHCIGNSAYLKLVFSAKEAVVKAVSASLGRFLDMREIQLSIEADFFSAHIKGFPDEIWGRWGHVGAFLLTLAVCTR